MSGSLALTTLAWRPFLDPIDAFHQWWWTLLVPMAFGIAVVYKAVRLRTLEHYWRHVGVLTTQIVVGMILLAVATHALVEWYAGALAAAAG